MKNSIKIVLGICLVLALATEGAFAQSSKGKRNKVKEDKVTELQQKVRGKKDKKGLQSNVDKDSVKESRKDSKPERVEDESNDGDDANEDKKAAKVKKEKKIKRDTASGNGKGHGHKRDKDNQSGKCQR